MFKKCILEPLLLSATKFPDSNAFCIGNNYHSYSEFIQRIVAISESLKSISETNIALNANDHLDTYASVFAIWITGKVFVPLNPDTPKERNQHVIDTINTKTILDSNETIKLASKGYDASVEWLQTHVTDANVDEQLAYIFFTSGSTGNPKGVPVSKKNVASFVDAFEELGFDLDENDRCLQMFELTFDLSVMSYLIPLLNGACVYTIPKDEIKFGYIFELMEEKELTIALMVPSILNYLRPYFDEINCPKMRYSLFCGEALEHKIVEEWSECLPNAKITNMYGPTENTIFCTNYTFQRNGVNDSLNDILSIGKAMKNNIIAVFNDDNNEVAKGETGELCLAGDQLTPGYFNNPELNAVTFFDTEYKGVDTRFYRTGDLCSERENGNVDFVGRKDTQVKVQGFRVELSEVEFYCKEGVSQKVAMVSVVLKNKSGNNEIVTVFESDEFDTKDLIGHLKLKIPSYMIPTQFYFIQPFPLNVNGKIDRNKIKELISK
ncbi:MAG: amino acid adenylation domain-containing protein [Flavobacteriales bacterium]|nr:amino acid adenylation domain-containing protein [Flavobacteriales bacterium]